jgi:hypothetical protein
MAGRKKSYRREAQAFVIWREARSVDWKCTVSEIAEATGIAPSTVNEICRERKWPVQRPTAGDRETYEPRSLTSVIGKLADRREPRSDHQKDPARALQRIIEGMNRGPRKTLTVV